MWTGGVVEMGGHLDTTTSKLTVLKSLVGSHTRKRTMVRDKQAKVGVGWRFFPSLFFFLVSKACFLHRLDE